MKGRIQFRLCIICLLVLIVTGCKVKRPANVIAESEMEDLLYDYHLARSMIDNLPNSESYKATLYTEAVFKKHKTTQEIFDSSMVWYTRNAEILSKIYGRVKKRMKDQQDNVNQLIAKRDKKPKVTEAGDSIDVWPWTRMIRLTGEMMDNQYTFVLPVDTNYQERDTLVWEVNYHFLKPLLADSVRMVTMAMQVIYEKDTISQLEWTTEQGMQEIRLYADTLGAIKEIKGFVYYSGVKGEKTGALLGDRIRLMRYHCTDSLSPAARDSVNKIEAARADSLRQVSSKRDSLRQTGEDDDTHSRLTPDELNRRRTGEDREKKSEQIEVEEHIQQERIEQRKERQRNQQRRQQQPQRRPSQR